MFTFKRLIGSSLFVFVLAGTVLTQESRVSIQKPGEAGAPILAAPLVTAAVTAERVRFVSPGTVVQLRLEIYNAAAQKLFDTELRGGNVLDWNLQDGAGERLPSGYYACVLTIKNLSGRLSQRIGVVTLSDNKATIEAAGAAQLSAAQQQTIGPVEGNAAVTVLHETEAEAITAVTHNGTEGQLTSTTGALTFRMGDLFSGKDVERVRITPEGNVGIGTDKPQAKLDVAGDIRSTGSLRLEKGVEFADGTVQTTGLSGRKDEDGNLVPNVGGTGTQNRLAKWTDNAGNLGDSIVVDTGNGLRLTAAASPVTDTNLISTSASSSTIGVIASPVQAFLAGNGPYFAMRGNTYSAIANQRGLFSISTGNVANPIGAEGSIVLLTGADQVRMFINPVGNIGIGTTAPGAKLDVAGDINTSTQYNIAGLRVLTISGTIGDPNINTFAGVAAGASNNFGGANSFFGASAGAANIAGFRNSFFGTYAGQANIGSSDNSFFGTQAGWKNTGSQNAMFGSGTGFNNTTGSNNSFFGYSSGVNVSNGQENTFIGANSGGNNGLSNATAIGAQAWVTQSNSLVLGNILNTKVGIGTSAPARRLHITGTGSDGAGQTDLRITGTGQIASGITLEATGTGGRTYSWLSTADNTGGGGSEPGRLAVFDVTAGVYRMVIDGTGQVGIGTFTPGYKLEVNGSVAGNGAYQALSDARFKKNIHPLSGALSKVMRLRGVSFDWRRDEFPALNFSQGRQVGFIAQETAGVLPEAVTTDNQGYYRMAYAEVTPMLVEAIKEQQQTIEQLKQQNNQLKDRNSRTVARLAALETTVKRMVHGRSRRHK